MIGQYFDPQAELLIHGRLRPHWSQVGAIVFVTFRTADSIPADVLARWEREKQDWVRRALSRGSLRDPTPSFGSLRDPTLESDEDSGATESAAFPTGAGGKTLVRGANHDDAHWSTVLGRLDRKQKHEFDFYFNRCRQVKLDECCGACVLKRPELAQIVADSLLHFDGERYRMGDFIVMPNHVHLLAAFADPQVMENQFDSWLHYTAFRINQRIGSKGHFWQQEPFDHLVRSPEQFDYLRGYIAQNPEKAYLRPGEYLYRRYE